jgi:hypothetical protein
MFFTNLWSSLSRKSALRTVFRRDRRRRFLAVEGSAGRALRVERLLLSCRVLGRGVEEEVFDELARRAHQEGFVALEVALVETARNIPARGFLERILEGV